jgi:hypothetical protein
LTALAESDSSLNVGMTQPSVINASSVVVAPSIVPASNAQGTTLSRAVRSAPGNAAPRATPSTTVKAPSTTRSVVQPPPSVTTTTSGSAHVEYGAATWLDTIPTGTCADNDAPMGSTVLITTTSGATAFCRVVSRGPFAVGRIVDVAKATFALLAPPSQGVVTVRVSW